MENSQNIPSQRQGFHVGAEIVGWRYCMEQAHNSPLPELCTPQTLLPNSQNILAKWGDWILEETKSSGRQDVAWSLVSPVNAP